MGMATFTPVFNAFRFYANGTESGATALAAQDTNISVDVSSGDVIITLRTLIQETGGAAGTDFYRLQFDRNGAASWTSISGSSSFIQTDATNCSLTGAGNTTNRGTDGIADGTGSFVAGRQAEDPGAFGLATTSFELTASNFTENVFGFELKSADLADGDTLDFRVTLGTGTPGMTNSVTPRITIIQATNATGTAAQTLPGLSQSASGEQGFTGTAAQTLPSLSQSATGDTSSAVSGTAAQGLPGLSQSATGEEGFTGAADQALPALAQAASGTVVENATGTAAQTLPGPGQSASGGEGFTGAAAQALPSLSQAAAGAEGFTGTAGQSLPALTQSADGTVTAATNATGTIAQVLPSLRQEIVGVVANPAVAAASLGGDPGRARRIKRERYEPRGPTLREMFAPQPATTQPPMPEAPELAQPAAEAEAGSEAATISIETMALDISPLLEGLAQLRAAANAAALAQAVEEDDAEVLMVAS